jgi:hypothetical protein
LKLVVGDQLPRRGIRADVRFNIREEHGCLRQRPCLIGRPSIGAVRIITEGDTVVRNPSGSVSGVIDFDRIDLAVAGYGVVVGVSDRILVSLDIRHLIQSPTTNDRRVVLRERHRVLRLAKCHDETGFGICGIERLPVAPGNAAAGHEDPREGLYFGPIFKG